MSVNLPRFRISDIAHEIGEEEIEVGAHSPEFEKAISKTGIPRVFRTTKDSYELSRVALSRLVDRNSDLIGAKVALVHVSQSNSDFLPAYSCRLQFDTGLADETLAFDVGQGCSGFVQGLYLASRLLVDVENVVLVCCDTYRAKLDEDDRSTSTIFSDAATATLVRRGGDLRLASSTHLTDGSGAKFLYHSRDETRNGGRLYMAGGDVLVFTKRVVYRQAEETIRRADMAMKDVRNVYVHQASKLVLDELERRFGDQVNFPRNIEEFGNTVSSSIPLLLRDRLVEVNGSTSVMCGFGVGLSSSCIVLTDQ
jgi:3-oxoacyl-[acyl-carrier-protein] synthase-3